MAVDVGGWVSGWRFLLVEIKVLMNRKVEGLVMGDIWIG